METLKKVTGVWRGSYGYEAPEQLANRDSVTFTLTLKQGWFGRFTGSVTDDDSGGMPGVGAIEGHFSYPHIEFTKRMPVCYIVAPDGRAITLREYLTEQDLTCERDLPHDPIFYQGEFSSVNRAHGTWIIMASEIPLGDGRAIEMPETRGVWQIEN